MKKIIISSLLIICSMSSFGQNEDGKLYKNYEDYTANKPIEGYSVVKGSFVMNFGAKSFKLNNNGKLKQTNLKKFPSPLFIQEKGGMLMRIFDNQLYYVIASGAICLYINNAQGRVYIDDENNYIFSFPYTGLEPKNYYSETITGEIKKLNNKILKGLLEEKGLLADFENEKPILKGTHNSDDIKTKKMVRIIKYIKLINN